jgi:hypothetical protein
VKGINARATLTSLFFGLAAVTPGQAEDYYFYEGPNGELVISNKEPPPGSKIIKRLPSVTDREVPQAQAQEPRKTPPNGQTEGFTEAAQHAVTERATCIQTPSFQAP